MNTTTNKVQVGDPTVGTSTTTSTSTTASQWQTCTHDKAERGWECPRCGRINAPWVRSCDCSRDNLTFTWSSPSTGSDEWWRQYVPYTSTSPLTQLDSETFKIHPESGSVYTTVAPGTIHKASSSICQADSSTAKSNPNEKIEVWSNGTTQWGGSDYWDEEKKCYTNGPDISSNCVTSANSPWNQFSTLTNQLDKLQYKIEELKETK